MRRVVGLLTLCIATAVCSTGQTFSVLANFNGSNGARPYAPLVLGTDGNFYGTTSEGGDNVGVGSGTVFKVTPGGQVTTLHVFDFWSNDYEPVGGLVLASDGNFYGATFSGTVFKITPAGLYTVIYASNGYLFEPTGGLVQASDGNFYGTTAAYGSFINGTVYRLTPQGALTTLHGFSGKDGAVPYAGLLLASDGNLYGTTAQGGDHGQGTIFRITTDGALTTLHSFDFSTDGSGPGSELIQASDGNLYGTTLGGGSGGSGTVFKTTLQGTLTTLHSFLANEGSGPNGLVEAIDGNLYGTTRVGGLPNYGTIFEINLDGRFTSLYQFSGSDDGARPWAALTSGNDGNLYGTTALGGTTNQGAVFRLGLYSVLSITRSGEGTVSSNDRHLYCGSQCSYAYLNGTPVVVSALPAPGYTFNGWTGCDKVNGSYCSVTMTGAKNVGATFVSADVTLTSLAFKPSYVRGGQLSAGTLALNAPAPPGGVTVTLSSDHPAVAHPPSFVFVPGGKSSAQFAVQTFPVRNSTAVTITATAGSSHAQGTLTVGLTALPQSIK